MGSTFDVKLIFYSYTIFYNPYADMCLDLTEGKEDYSVWHIRG